jgi:iron complex outermembrane receptor protein
MTDSLAGRTAPTRQFSRLAQCIAAICAASGALPITRANAADSMADNMDEIVVTATRRSESVSDVPYNISAVGAADIRDAGVTDLQGLTHMIPGLVSPDLGPRASSINGNFTIRGLNASSVNAEDQMIAAPLVSTYVDETPLFANIKMTDIERVEVLRGPQGTLYGSGSVGGTVRMIHNPPDLTSTEFDVSTRASHTQNAANPNEAVDVIANIPLSDTMAFRGSGGYEKLAGFTNAASVAVLGANAQPVLANPTDPLTSGPVFTEHRGVDHSETWYTRGALLWKASDALQFTLSYQHQTDQSGGYSQVAPGQRYTQTLYMDQPGSTATDLGSLDASYDMGFATLTSSSSFTHQAFFSQYDLTGLIEELAALYGNYPRTLSPIIDNSSDHIFTQEIRLVSKQSGPWDWVGGAYYSDRKQSLSQVEPILGFASWSELPGSGRPAGCTVYNATTCPYPTFGDVIQYYQGGVRPSSEADPDLNFTLDRHVTFSDLAAFNETSYHFTDKWQVTGGARIFWQHYDQTLAQTLPMCGVFCSASGTDPTGLVDATQEKGFRNHVFKFNTSYEIAPHTLLYATWSEGFRRGGVNALPTGNCYYCETPSLLTYKPDEARNTEVGIKGSFAHGASYTFTLYHIDWKDPQIEASTVAGGFDFVTNGDKARSQGVEAELTLPVTDTLKLEFGYSYTDAKLTASFTRGEDDLTGVSGDRLPGVSKEQGTAAADYSLPLSNDRDFHARLDASYRSDFWTSLPHSPTATDLPGFALVNARAGMGFARNWRVDAYINNLTSQIAATSVSTEPGLAHNRAEFVGRPRTVGLELNYSFKD